MWTHNSHTFAADKTAPVAKLALADTHSVPGGVLLVLNGPSGGEQVELHDKPITVGSALGCDLVLADRTVSRRHLRVADEDGQTVARDLGTTNGSFTHGSRFRELILGYGAELRLGRTVLKFVSHHQASELAEHHRFGGLVGQDAKMRRLFGLLRNAAATHATLLIEGETGTGKELVAQEVHRRSRRASGPFVIFDCGAVPRQLVQSAIFGHIKGAFTGAHADRKGVFAEAHGGTLFLDEIDSLPFELQSSLLRPLDQQTLRRVGDDNEQPVNVRVIAATNQNLQDAVARGKFRADLFYRLAVLRVRLPPLRERGSDLDLLVHHFVQRFANGRSLVVSAAELQRLRGYSWPGNVRELRNVLERACLLAKGYPLQVVDALDAKLDLPISAPSLLGLPFKAAKNQLIEEFECAYLLDLIRRHPKNLSEAARAAQLDRHHLRSRIRHYGLQSRLGCDWIVPSP